MFNVFISVLFLLVQCIYASEIPWSDIALLDDYFYQFKWANAHEKWALQIADNINMKYTLCIHIITYCVAFIALAVSNCNFMRRSQGMCVKFMIAKHCKWIWNFICWHCHNNGFFSECFRFTPCMACSAASIYFSQFCKHFSPCVNYLCSIQNKSRKQ